MQLEFVGVPFWIMFGVGGALLIGTALVVSGISAKGTRSGFLGTSLSTLTLRFCSVLLLLAALAGPSLVEEHQESNVVMVVDVSDSMDDATATQLVKRAHSLAAGSAVQTVVFAGSASSKETLHGAQWEYSSIRNDAGALNVGQTNLESAFQELLRGVSQQQSFDVQRADSIDSKEYVPVILISDGQETKGGSRSLVAPLRQAGYKIFPLTPELMESAGEQLGISALHAPLVAPAQKSVEVSIAIRNTTDSDQSGTLVVTHEDRVILERKVLVGSQSEVLLTTQSDPSQDGIKKIVATFVPEDKQIPESKRRIFLSGEPRERVLVIHGERVDGRFLDDALKGHAYQLESVVGRSDSGVFSNLSRFSTVILNNVALRQLPESAGKNLRTFVEAGGGLIVSGGAQSFGLGGYQNSTLDDLLPVRSIPPKAEQRRLNVAVQLVIDKSQSMSKEQRLEFAKEAARAVVQQLKDEDYIGVIGFDVTPFEVLKTTQVGGNREYAIERIGRMYPKDQTWLLPALREARRRLEGTPAGRKHMIIVTDGQLRDAGPVYLEDVRQARLLGITVSTVLIGGEFDFGFLRSLSEAGGGSFYAANDPSQLPRIFIQDVNVRSGEKTLRESERFPVRFGTGEVRSTRIRSFPFLKGFVETRIKPEANYELAVASGADLHPLLASWRRGKGNVIAFTSDNNGRWSSEWIGWGQFQRFWSEVIDATRSDAVEGAKQVRFDLRHYVEGETLQIEVAVFDDIGAQSLSAGVDLPSGERAVLKFENVSKGRYLVELPHAVAGKYKVELETQSEKYQFAPVAFDVSGESFGERKGLGFNIPLLEELSGATGGAINPAADQITRAVQRYKVRTDLQPYFLLASLGALLIEILLRELGLRRPRLRFRFN